MTPVSVCIIAKNEEKRIERLLSSLKPYDFELVVVDTGSTDATKTLAAKYTSCIYDFTWCDDFSAARNFSLSKASHDWILMLDCDEWVEHLDLEELDYFRKHLSHAAGSVTRRNLTGTPDAPAAIVTDQTERFFSRKLFTYTGTIHEQLTPKFEKTFETYLLNTVIGHDGYLMTEDERAAKSRRNITLLEKQLLQKPGDTYTLYQLGKGYEMIQDAENACLCFEKALRPDLDFSLAYTQELLLSYGETLLDRGEFAKALKLEAFQKYCTDTADFTYLMGLIYLKNERYEQALDAFEKALTFERANREGANSFLAYYEIGKILSMISEWEMAANYFRRCGSYPPAQRALQILREETGTNQD